MTDAEIQLTARVVAAAGREQPADAALREALGSRRLLTREQTRAVSRAVFTYFRWFGWLDRARPLPSQIRHALDLAHGFAERPESFSNEKLVDRCVPDWARAQIEVTPGWVRTLQSEPSLWLRARRGQGETLVAKLGAAKLESTRLPDAVIYKGEEDLFRRPEFHAGEFEIQDISSQAVGWLCDPQPGETWWDACAGEGGKLLHLSDLMQNQGLIWASDRAEWRLKHLKRRAARAGVFNYRAAVWDGGARLPTKTKFDGVLVDAPCSGVGTWQRNPHARWTSTPKDVEELAAVQKRLLAHAAMSVKPGGKLIYSVCTMTRAETVEVVEAFAVGQPEFRPRAMELLALGQKQFMPGASIMIWPQDLGGNGMFIAAWQRQKKPA